MASAEEKQRRRAMLRSLKEQERASIQAYLERRRTERRFFVVRLDPSRCQVQVLKRDGTSRAEADYMDVSAPLEVGGEVVPVEVLSAGLRRTTFDGDYVNEKGESIPRW